MRARLQQRSPGLGRGGESQHVHLTRPRPPQAVQVASLSLQRGFVNLAAAGALASRYMEVVRSGLPVSAYAAGSYEDFQTIGVALNTLTNSVALMWSVVVNASDQAAFNAAATADIASWGVPQLSGHPFAIFAWPSSLPPAPFMIPLARVAPLLPAYLARGLLLDTFTDARTRPALSALLETKTAGQTPILWLSLSATTTVPSYAASIYLSPVFDTSGPPSPPPTSSEATNTSPVVGVIGVAFRWQDLIFADMVRAGVTGIVAQLSGPTSPAVANQTQLFALAWGVVQELPQGVHSSSEAAFAVYDAANPAELTGTFGPGWSLKLWPTDELRAKYITGGSSLGLPTLAAVLICVLVNTFLLLFAGFLFLTSRNTRMLIRLWRAAEAVVDDVFPGIIRNALVEEQLQRAPPRSALKSTPATASAPSVRGGGGGGATARSSTSTITPRESTGYALGDGGGGGGAEPGGGGALIAELYPAVSIVFADVVGFTDWSATVEPREVLHVLETIFAAFDVCARRWGVAKIETVGDCYVACAGCPHPCPLDHAQRAADFSLAILGAFGQATHQLGVRQLKLRVGMHSGPIVGGVIRCENRRFQLFGDSINFASRMESTGAGGKIQVSAASAKLLLDGGRHSLQRRGMVDVKGKGRVTTFWLVVRGHPHSRKATDSPSASTLAAGMVAVSLSLNLHSFTDSFASVAGRLSTGNMAAGAAEAMAAEAEEEAEALRMMSRRLRSMIDGGQRSATSP